MNAEAIKMLKEFDSLINGLESLKIQVDEDTLRLCTDSEKLDFVVDQWVKLSLDLYDIGIDLD